MILALSNPAMTSMTQIFHSEPNPLDAKFAVSANGVWIFFLNTPTLLDIQTARNLLGEVTDQILRDKLNEPKSV